MNSGENSRIIFVVGLDIVTIRYALTAVYLSIVYNSTKKSEVTQTYSRIPYILKMGYNVALI